MEPIKQKFTVILYRFYGDTGIKLGCFNSIEAAKEFVAGIIGIPATNKEEFDANRFNAGLSIK